MARKRPARSPPTRTVGARRAPSEDDRVWFLRHDAQWQGIVPARKNGESQSWEANWVMRDCGSLLGVTALLGITGC